VTDKLPVSVLIAAKNEELNIRKCLASLGPAEEIILVDSASTDGTAHVASEEFRAQVVQFEYAGGYPKKRQWALESLDFAGEWILLLDADEVVPEGLWREIASVIEATPPNDAYLVRKGFHFLGRRFRHGGFSHRAVFLLRKGRGRFEELVDDAPGGLDMEVHERVIVDGELGELKTPLVHEDFKGLEAYLERHNRYSTWEARLRFRNRERGRYGERSIRSRLFGNAQERRRFLKRIVVKLPFEPLVWFCYHYFVRLGFLEGRAGFIACRIRAAYIAQVRCKLYELRLAERQAGGNAR
jgi:glycosyltransferase involved in cell wall biosynthesis